MWKNLKFSAKVWLLVSVFIIFSVITAIGYHFMANQIKTIGIENASSEMLSGYTNELKDVVDVMTISLAAATKGVADEKEVHKIYSNIAKDVRFFPDKSGYFFIYKEGGDVFVHAAKPSLEGKNLFELKDPDGKFLIKELEKAAKSGGGFVEYQWEKPGKGLQPKLSYTRMIPNTNFWIGTGVYIDDIEEKNAIILSKIDDFSKDFLIKLFAVLALIFFLIIMPLTIYMIKSMVIPLTNLTDIAVEYSRGKLDSEFTDTERQDEVGALSRAVKRLGRSTKIVMQKLQEVEK